MTAQARARGFPMPRPSRPTVPDYRPAPLTRPGQPGRWPSNDPARHPFRDPFRTPKIPARRFPFRVPGWLPAAAAAVTLIDPANWWPKDEGSPPGMNPGAGWVRTAGPFPWPGYGSTSPLNDPPMIWSGTTYHTWLSGQANSHITQITTSRSQLGVWHCYTTGAGVHRHANFERWSRPTPGPAQTFDPAIPGRIGNQPFPVAQPYSIPIQGYPSTYPDPGALPGPRPVAPPYPHIPHVPRQWPDEGGNYPPGVPGLPWKPPARPNPALPVDPASPPAPGQDTVVTYDWNYNPGQSHRQAERSSPRVRHRRRRDRRKNDNKARSKILLSTWAAASAITETADLIDVAFAALPKEVRKMYGPNPPPHVKAAAVVKHWEKMSTEVFAEKFIENAIEDAVYGLLGKYAANFSKKLGEVTGRPVGVETGNTTRQGQTRRAETEQRYRDYRSFNAQRQAQGKRPITFKYWAARYDDRQGSAIPLDVFFNWAKDQIGWKKPAGY